MPASLAPQITGQDLARVQSVITRPKATRVVGPRRAAFRRWASILISAWVVSLPINSALEHSGLLDELAGAVAPAAQIQSAPEQVKWVPLPSSPFLSAGNQDDGTFSIEKMARAWERAGLPENASLQVAAKVNFLRPVIMGRMDPGLERQLVAEAAQVARQLKQTYPEVHAYLESGKENPKAASWEYGVSPIENLLSNPLPEQDWTLPARLNKMLAWNQSEKGQKMPLILPSVLQPGLTPEGFSSEALVGAWRRSGMSPAQAMSALALSKQALPDMHAVFSNRQHSLIMQSHAVNLDINENFTPYLKAMATSGKDLEVLPEGWSEQDWDAMWESVEVHVQESGVAPQAMPGQGTMKQALEHLGRAVHTTGLRALSLSLDAWQSPDVMFQVAQRLNNANAQLEQITGWEGKVLGLDGRVELSLGRPVFKQGYGGMVFSDRPGRLQMLSDWGALGHEWFHAFDVVISRTTMARSTVFPLSDNMQPLRRVSDSRVHSAMKELIRTTDEDTPLWRMNREASSKEKETSYWVSPVEVLAFGFETMAEEVHGAGALGVIKENRRQRIQEPAKGPSLWEVQALEKPFRDLFDAAAPLGLAGSSATLSVDFPRVSMEGKVSDWQAQRITAAGLEVPAPPKHTTPTFR